MTEQQYLADRVDDQIAWYDQRAGGTNASQELYELRELLRAHLADRVVLETAREGRAA